MMNLFALLLGAIWRVFRARRSLLLENLALRQQLAVLKRRHPRPRLTVFDKFFWVCPQRFWSGWKQVEEAHAGAIVFIPQDTWIGVENIGKDHLVSTGVMSA